MPKHRRATMVMLNSTCVPLGAAIGGLLAAFVIPRGGWQWVFISCGLLTLVVVPLQLVFMPESLRKLALQTGQEKRIRAILRRIEPGIALGDDTQFRIQEEKAAGFPIGELFRQRRALTTICLCTALFVNMMALYFLSNWLPTLINNVGFSIEAAVLATTCLQLGGVAGNISIGLLADRIRPATVLMLAFVTSALFIAGIAAGNREYYLLIGLVFVAGAGCSGAQLGSIYLSSISYPTEIRTTGVGWALGVGRLGAVLGPIIGGILLSFRWPYESLFLLAAIPPVIGALAAFTIGREALKLGLDHARRARPRLRPAE